MTVYTKNASPRCGNPEDNALRAIDQTIEGIVCIYGGPSVLANSPGLQAEFLARAAKFTNDPTLPALILAAVLNRAVPPGYAGTQNTNG